jgi:hypothetical protein
MPWKPLGRYIDMCPDPPYFIQPRQESSVTKRIRDAGFEVLPVTVPDRPDEAGLLRAIGAVLSFPPGFPGGWEQYDDHLLDYGMERPTQTVILLRHADRLLAQSPRLLCVATWYLMGSTQLIASRSEGESQVEYLFSGQWQGER